MSKEELKGYYENTAEKIRQANQIMIIGGGPTGVELAAEVVIAYPKKKVTIVHSGVGSQIIHQKIEIGRSIFGRLNKVVVVLLNTYPLGRIAECLQPSLSSFLQR